MVAAERFGHELTDELVNYLNQIDAGYRSELRELNELNFARFDARLIRWILVFWAGSTLTILGTMLAWLKG